LLRTVAERRLPGLGLKHQRKAYPPEVLARQFVSLKESVRRAWDDHEFGRLADLGVVDPAKLKPAFALKEAGGFEDLVGMYVLMSAERWARAHTSD